MWSSVIWESSGAISVAHEVPYVAAFIYFFFFTLSKENVSGAREAEVFQDS